MERMDDHARCCCFFFARLRARMRHKCDATAPRLTECSPERQIVDTSARKSAVMFRNHYRLGKCKDCGTESVLRRRVPRHDLHLLLTIATMGFWGVCWVITVVAARWEPWRCRICRRPQGDGRQTAPAPDTAPTEVAVGSGFGLVHEHVD